ncbi:hypothetical protein CsSME_00046703 [Camellia sinensis var. sinensis]
MVTMATISVAVSLVIRRKRIFEKPSKVFNPTHLLSPPLPSHGPTLIPTSPPSKPSSLSSNPNKTPNLNHSNNPQIKSNNWIHSSRFGQSGAMSEPRSEPSFLTCIGLFWTPLRWKISM